MHHAAKEGFKNICSILIDSGSDSSRVTKKGFTALHLAVKYNRLVELEYMIEKGNCDINAKALGGLTALHIGAHYSHENIIKDSGHKDHTVWSIQYGPYFLVHMIGHQHRRTAR